ncbi:MAG: nucleotidyltransferase domain-containing protein [Deltaproteobacteria bacterium]|nr:nucleotidyltransferase domain-containing protein [Deltaproteobacteria bacterium]
MASKRDTAIKIARKYIEELDKNNIPVSEAVIFGSYARGDSGPESDIDIAVISDAFSGDRFEDRRKIIPFRRKIDSRIEPIPFRPEDYQNGGILAKEIKKTGIILK